VKIENIVGFGLIYGSIIDKFLRVIIIKVIDTVEGYA